MKKFILILAILFASCNNSDIKKIRKFSPIFSTKLDLANVDTVKLISYLNGKAIDTFANSLKYKFKVDNSSFQEINWKFILKDSFIYNYDYKLILDFKRSKKIYLFSKIKRDTFICGKTIGYYINGKKHSMYDYPNFYIDE